MKHYLLTTIGIALTIFSGSSAGDVIINNSNKASPATIIARTFERAVNDSKMDFHQSNNCEDADNKFNSSKNAVMIYNADVGIAALASHLNCPLRATADQTIFVAKSYLKLCKSVKNSTELVNAKTVGAASVILSKGLIEDYNSNGLHLTGVPYSGSKTVLAGVIAKDIDFGFIGSGVADPAITRGDIICPLSTDPRREDFVGKKYKLKIPTLPIIKVFYTNSTDLEIINKLKTAITNPIFLETIAAGGYSDIKTSKFTTKDISDVQTHINDSYTFYWR